MTATADAFFGIFGMTRVEQPVILNVTVPIEVTNAIGGSNGKGRWVADRVKAQREAVSLAVRSEWGRAGTASIGMYTDDGARITILRPHTKKRLDDDNLAGCLKAVRDGVADAIGIDDGDPRLFFRYAQCPARQVGQKLAKPPTRKEAAKMKARLDAYEVLADNAYLAGVAHGVPSREHDAADDRRAEMCQTLTAAERAELNRRKDKRAGILSPPPKRRNVAAYDTHIRIRIEIVPAADVDPLLTAVRVLSDKMMAAAYCVEDYELADEMRAVVATADALSLFNPMEMYR